jgi:hypothetical protein
MPELVEKPLNGSRKQLARRLKEAQSPAFDEGLELR